MTRTGAATVGAAVPIVPPAGAQRVLARWPLPGLRRTAAIVTSAVVLAAGAAPAVGPWLLAERAEAAERCERPAGFVERGRIESGDLVLLYRAVPASIEIGQHFSVEVIACAPPGAPVTALRVDATMPEHQHGMNYRARVAAAGDARYVAEGLLFHMPGRWQLLFDVERSGRTERLTADLVVE